MCKPKAPLKPVISFSPALLRAGFFLGLYLLLPFSLVIIKAVSPLRLALYFYFPGAAVCLFMFRNYSLKKERLEYLSQEAKEKINLFNNESEAGLKNYAALEAQVIRYNSLKKIVGDINQDLLLDNAANRLIEAAFSLAGSRQGAALLYLIDKQAQGLKLFKALKDDAGLVIKAKQGDLFDAWVIRHAVPLIIEDVNKDFRFDPEKLKAQDQRPVGSLISSPFLSEKRLLGLLRLDNRSRNFYSQDDLRLLLRICDLGAVALENSELFARTQELAIHDELTGLYTKAYLLKHLEEEALKCSRSNMVFSVLMLDIDFFKNYNDTFGHTAGDIVLKKISGLISQKAKGSGGFCARFGGEEFCVVLPGMGRNESLVFAKDICAKTAGEKIILRRQETSVTVSIGVVSFPADADNPEGLISMADRAMYEAKEEGRNRVCCS